MSALLPRLRGLPLYLPAAMIAIGGWTHRWMNEDAYINLRIVDQIFAGHGPVFNAGERIEAATSPLWLAVLVLGRAMFGLFVRDEWIAVIASLIAAVAAFTIAGRATGLLHRNDDGVAVPIGLILVAAVAVVWDFSTSGLEMGLVFLWIAASWFVLVAVARTPTMSGRRRFGFGLVLGLAPLVRPELGLMMVCFLVAWFALVQPRRVRFDLVAIFTLPVLYQIFRMGYYATVVPNTALAKDAGHLYFGQGWRYAKDFVGSYHLWVTAALVAGVVLLEQRRRQDRRIAVATTAMIAAAVVNAAYIVAIGGDYMHGRLLLPAFVAFALPASVSIRKDTVAQLGVGAAAGVWALVSVIAFRPPPVAITSFGVPQISDWRTVTHAKIVLDDDALGINGHDAAAAYARGVRGYYRLEDREPRTASDPDAFVLLLGSIGAPAYNAGRRIWVVDIGGLAEPLAARTTAVPGRAAGHRKEIALAWYDARFTPPSPSDSPQVVAARHVLTCPAIADLLDAVDSKLTLGRFLSNLWHSVDFTTLEVPADPIEAERRYCPS